MNTWIRFVCGVLIATIASFAPAADTTFRFDFGSGKPEPGYTKVLPTTTYSKDRGFGFEPGSIVTGVDRGGTDALHADYCTSDKTGKIANNLGDFPDAVRKVAHDNYGSYELAKCVVEGIRQNHLELAKFLVDDVPAFDPAHPDPIENFKVPASPTSAATAKPDGN